MGDAGTGERCSSQLDGTPGLECTKDTRSWSSQYAEKQPWDLVTLPSHTGLLEDVSGAGLVSAGLGEERVHLFTC